MSDTVTAIAIAGLVLLILIMGALMNKQAGKIQDLKVLGQIKDDALTDALEGKNPEMFLESSGMNVIIKKQKPKPWEEEWND